MAKLNPLFRTTELFLRQQATTDGCSRLTASMFCIASMDFPPHFQFPAGIAFVSTKDRPIFSVSSHAKNLKIRTNGLEKARKRTYAIVESGDSLAVVGFMLFE